MTDTEQTKPSLAVVNPHKTVPRAIMLVALIGGGIFVAVSYVTQLVHRGGVFATPTSFINLGAFTAFTLVNAWVVFPMCASAGPGGNS